MRRSTEDTKKFLTEVCNLQTNKIAYHLVGWNGETDYMTRYTTRDFFMDYNVMLERQLKVFKMREPALDDYVPALFPYLGVGILASAFGCKTTFPEAENPWTEPLIRDDASVADTLRDADTQAGLLKNVLDATKFLQDKTEGKYDIRITDIQSPIDTTSIIWNYEDLLMAMYTNPKEVHKVLKLVTNLIIKFVKLQRSLIKKYVPNHCPGMWVPQDWGISLSEDLIAILSPDLYREFSVPYLNIIAEEFGGVSLHSCGHYAHNLDNLLKVNKLLGLNFSITETDMEPILEKFNGKILFECSLGLNTGKRMLKNTFEYLDKVFHTIKPNTNLYLFIPQFSTKGEDIKIEDVYKVLKNK